MDNGHKTKIGCVARGPELSVDDPKDIFFTPSHLTPIHPKIQGDLEMASQDAPESRVPRPVCRVNMLPIPISNRKSILSDATPRHL